MASLIELITQLREATGCGMMKCKEALVANNNDYEAAVDWLRKKGLSTAAKKSERVTTEGLVAVNIDNNKASIIEVNSETDFVARNEKFQDFVVKVSKAALNVANSDNYVEDLKAQVIDGKKIGDELVDKIATIGENLQIRRGKTITLNGNGAIVSYVHSAIAPNLGKIAVLLALKSDANKEKLNELGKQICMHIAASKPEFISREDVPADRLQREKDICAEQSKASGKPANIIEKMVEGRIRKFYEEICLLEQSFIMDPDKKVSEIIKSFEKENNCKVEVQEYELYVLGSGLQKKEENFAEEVASMTK